MGFILFGLFVFMTFLFIVFAVFFPEIIGITGKKALQIQKEQMGIESEKIKSDADEMSNSNTNLPQ